jgi:hypothetical protein
MTFKDISTFRLYNQQITGTHRKNAKDIVSWMGAMQAQDFNMAKWAVGIRLPGTTDELIQAALDKGQILRTHVLRPTWHLVSAADIYWMLELTASHIMASARSRWKQLELTETILNKSLRIIEEALAGGNHLTREELCNKLAKTKIATNDQRAAHIMFYAELQKIVCSGTIRKKQQTYALLSERVPKQHLLSREESLAALAKKYFMSHGPATMQDFGWWSGLTLTETKKALEMIKSDLVSVKINTEMYWGVDLVTASESAKGAAYLLPAYDEFIISYKNRSASLAMENHGVAISNNGIFRPVVIVDGQVTGIWSRTIKKDTLLIEMNLFKSPGKKEKTFLEKAAESFGAFLNKKTEIIHHVK